MAVTDRDTLQGEIEITGRPAKMCWGKPLDYANILVKIFRVKFPVNRGNDFIVKGFQTPSTDDRNRLWAKFDKNGNPFGWWAFIKGQWRIFYTVVPGEVKWIIGNSANPPAGWRVITTDTPGLNVDIVNSYVKDYIEDGLGGFSKFAVIYVGY